MKRKSMPTGNAASKERKQGKPPGNTGVNKPVRHNVPKKPVGTRRMEPTQTQKL